MGKNGLGRRLYLPWSILDDQISWLCKVITLLHFYQCHLHHMDDALVAAKQQGETALGTAGAPKLEEPYAPGLSSSPTHSTEILPPYLFYWIFLLRTPLLWGVHSLSLLLTLCRKRGTALLVGHSVIITSREPRSILQRWRLGVNTALQGVMTTCPN